MFVGFQESANEGAFEWSSLLFVGVLKTGTINDQESIFLDVGRIVVTNAPSAATALRNRDAIGVEGHIVTAKSEFNVPVMTETIVSPRAMASLGLKPNELVPATDTHAAVSRQEYFELIARGDNDEINQVNKTTRDWLRGEIDKRNLKAPTPEDLAEVIRPLVKSAKKIQLARLARILLNGAGTRLYQRASVILGGSPEIQRDVAMSAYSTKSLRRAVPPSVVKMFEGLVNEPRIVLAVSADGVWLVTGGEAVNAIRKLIDLIGFYEDKDKEAVALTKASRFYSTFTPTIRKPIIPPPPSDPLYPRKGSMPRQPRGGSRTTTATVVSVPKSRTGDVLLDAVQTRGALDGAVAAAKLGNPGLLRAFGGRIDTVKVRNKNYAGDAAWARYRAKVQLVEERYAAAVSRHHQRIASGAYNSNPVWIRFQSELSSWNKKKTDTIAAWNKQSADLLAAWNGDRKQQTLTAINNLRKSRRAQLAQIRKAATALQTGGSQRERLLGANSSKKTTIYVIPS
ncbi:MAG: hypothetical protein QGG09_06665, partial [Pirellulaceae bacterium]|nr:hypothetical protein [Pirellulaceae bacterium]